jgi:hypothetical protein
MAPGPLSSARGDTQLLQELLAQGVPGVLPAVPVQPRETPRKLFQARNDVEGAPGRDRGRCRGDHAKRYFTEKDSKNNLQKEYQAQRPAPT